MNMKTKFTLLIASLAAITSSAFAGPSDSAVFALKAAKEQQQNTATVVTSSDFKTVLVPNGKGGFIARAERDTATPSIALSKSPKAKACESSACCAKR